MKLFDHTTNLLEKSLNYSSTKNRVISNNIANVDTPSFKAQDVVFKDVLNNEMKQFNTKRTHSQHIDFAGSTHQPHQVVTKANSMYNHNGNNVDIDKEMSELAKNQIYYRGLIDRMNGKFANLQTVIRGGR